LKFWKGNLLFSFGRWGKGAQLLTIRRRILWAAVDIEVLETAAGLEVMYLVTHCVFCLQRLDILEAHSDVIKCGINFARVLVFLLEKTVV
jgi:hypothetical protein